MPDIWSISRFHKPAEEEGNVKRRGRAGGSSPTTMITAARKWPFRSPYLYEKPTLLPWILQMLQISYVYSSNPWTASEATIVLTFSFPMQTISFSSTAVESIYNSNSYWNNQFKLDKKEEEEEKVVGEEAGGGKKATDFEIRASRSNSITVAINRFRNVIQRPIIMDFCGLFIDFVPSSRWIINGAVDEVVKWPCFIERYRVSHTKYFLPLPSFLISNQARRIHLSGEAHSSTYPPRVPFRFLEWPATNPSITS